MFEQKFGFSVVVFCSHAAISLIFTVFSIFRIGFFSKWFFQSIHSYSRPSFLFELNFHFSLVVFCVHMLHFDIDVLFFSFFFI